MLAAEGVEVPVPPTLDGSSFRVLGGAAPVVGVLAVLVFLLLLWAVFIRKPGGRRERGRLVEGRAKQATSADDSATKSGRRHRRRREKKRPRNATLAETGGLPPLGAGDSKPPP